MKNEKIIKMALEVIESIAGHIGCNTQKQITINKKDIDDIYIFAHVARGRCANPHLDWRRKLIKTHKEMKERGLL